MNAIEKINHTFLDGQFLTKEDIINLWNNTVKIIPKNIANKKYWILTKKDIWIKYYLIDNKIIIDSGWNCRYFKN